MKVIAIFVVLLLGALWVSSREPANAAQQPPAVAAPKLGVEARMPALPPSQDWLNSPPLTAADLRGKVVVVNFWTYTCINWLRTLPYLRGWSEKYKEQGVVVIGVHSPEFSFEKDIARVRQATKQLHVPYPVLIDSNHAVWRSFENQYWPATYVVDGQGRIRFHQFGEGRYEETERAIQQLLADQGTKNVDHGLLAPVFQGAEAQADWRSLGSPENYLGLGRTSGFASPGGMKRNKPATYVATAKLHLNEWALSGSWTASSEAVTLSSAPGRIIYRFHSRDVHMVMGARTSQPGVRFRVTIDGAAPGAAHGADTDAEGVGTVTDHRLYQLLRQSPPIKDRQVEIEFLDPGLEAYAVTFG
jgi:thiol-disulfide isomerase/thioredoxin